jgi:ribosome-associated translation inhibitor RaiA
MKSAHANTSVRHKLQVHFDAHECQPTPEELAGMADDLDSLARQVGNFPLADARVNIEWNGRNNEYAVKLALLLTGEPIVTSDHDRVLHAAFDRALASLEHAVEAYKERLDRVSERRRQETGTDLELTPAILPDADALDAAVEAGDYAAFRGAVAPYEDSLRLRVGRWVERYPAVQGMMGNGLDVADVVEGVFLAAFEEHPRRQPDVRYGEWLETLIDPTVRAIEQNPAKELDNINMVRSASDAARPRS